MEKTLKRMADGKVVINNIVYDTNINKRINISNPETGNKISSIIINEAVYYPVAITKEKKTKEKMATIS